VRKLLNHYQITRAYTELLCKPLEIEDYIPQAADFTSPPKWHLAHTTWFFEEMILSKHLDEYVVFDNSFGFLFNSYYQGIGDRAVRSQRGLITRPTVEQVYAYRHYVDKHIQKLLIQDTPETVEALVVLGINHEQQHQELLLTDLKYTFSFNSTFPAYDENKSLIADHNTLEGWVSIDEGVYDIGYTGDEFCFDNELGAHKVYLHDYAISQALVTNGEYIDFIDSGAYQNFQYWLDEGWAWVCQHDIRTPLYWQKIDGEWFYYTLAGLRPIDRDAILSHVSYYEANAFANWKNMRLPTELEWEVASKHFDWGKRWEWTSSAYQPYPNFNISEGAVGEYNGKFMINQMVLRGASVATSTGHSRSTYRNFFHPHFQWQYSGIRLVK
jgi:ergothioneine biosynthesis protein EgtB